MPTLAFDVYGTLIDTSGVTEELKAHVGGDAPAFSDLWRQKQLEYSFRRGLMRRYQDFSLCTKNALDYAASFFDADISRTDKDKLLAGYCILPTFSDVKDGLEGLSSAGFDMYAFSNGRADDVKGLLKHAEIDGYFTDSVSVDEVKSFKPDPAVYKHLLKRTGSEGNDTWLISSNPFDVIGALSAGMHSAWVRRSPDAVFDPWDMNPDVMVSDIGGLRYAIDNHQRQD